MNDLDTPAPDLSGLPCIIAVLEDQLTELDRMSLHIGAAHVDAAIQHLRTEQARSMIG
ncbi:hypothetical protein J3454_02310 [Erythrobacter sp. NFXS35]|uniref:hypothetical protein n=1 Tax=Erythrobacter sp. NFXS35 TaxID=2818436 RepID=UPI0032DEBE09